jgi:hypothetical protein
LEQFRAIVQIIEENADLANQVKRIRWQHGAEEIQTAQRQSISSSKLEDRQLVDCQSRKPSTWMKSGNCMTWKLLQL